MPHNYLAIIVAAVLQFIFAAIWYTVIFGKAWGTIHGFEKHSKAEQEKMQQGMMPLLVAQFVITAVTTYVLALFLNGLSSEWHAFGVAGFVWLGFVLPTQISAVIFGGTNPKWMVKKIAIMAGSALGCLMTAAAVLHFMR